MFLPKCIKIYSTKPEIAHFCAVFHKNFCFSSHNPSESLSSSTSQLSHEILKLLNFVVTFFLIPENDYECFFRRICDHVLTPHFKFDLYCSSIFNSLCKKNYFLLRLFAKSEKIRNWNAIIFFSLILNFNVQQSD